MSRLASLQPKTSGSSPTGSGPSSPRRTDSTKANTPTPTPSKSNPADNHGSGSAPSTPRSAYGTPKGGEGTPRDRGRDGRRGETTYHRLLKLVIAEVKGTVGTWDELVLLDGLKAGKGCVDEATEMDNILLSAPGSERQPIGPHLEKLYEHRRSMNIVLRKLERCLVKLSALVDQAEKLFFEACRTQGWDFVLSQPMWLTWSFERLIESLSPVITAHNTHLAQLRHLSKQITDPQTSFDKAKSALEQWRDIGRGGERWDTTREWEELIDLEMSYGGAELEEAEDEDDMNPTIRSQGKKKGKRR